ncbi:MAG: hypothetical protein PHH11_14805 [Methylomonas sp.]|nr:hypothetical protein [Methylomonas sp.]
MNKLLISAFAVCMLSGCTNLKYPGWEQVKIELSVDGKSCERRALSDTCPHAVKETCDIWHKRRATLVPANTVVFDDPNSGKTGKYFQCGEGFRSYVLYKFDAQNYKDGTNSVTGQAFLTQKGGGVVTCAGERVLMFPNTPYYLADPTKYPVEQSNQAKQLIKESVCDASGNFEFDEIPDGQWIIKTFVLWQVPEYHYMGRFSYYDDATQGGLLQRVVDVKTGEKNKFIITR